MPDLSTKNKAHIQGHIILYEGTMGMNNHGEEAHLPGGRILKCYCRAGAVKDLGNSTLFP